MSIPYARIRSQINLRDIPCAMCGAVTPLPVIDHCHEHGATRGVVCVSCNNRMARVDADLSIATPRDMFHRDNCPGCRAEGFAGVSRRMTRRSRGTGAKRVVTPVAKLRHASKARQLDAVRGLVARHGRDVPLAVIMGELGCAKATASRLRTAANASAQAAGWSA